MATEHTGIPVLDLYVLYKLNKAISVCLSLSGHMTKINVICQTKLRTSRFIICYQTLYA